MGISFSKRLDSECKINNSLIYNFEPNKCVSGLPESKDLISLDSDREFIIYDSKKKLKLIENNITVIENDNANSNEIFDKKIQILLLGLEGSGKSTILKQIKMIYQNGFLQEELNDYKPFIYENIIKSFKLLIDKIINSFSNLDIDTQKSIESVKSIKSYLKNLEFFLLKSGQIELLLNYENDVINNESFNIKILYEIKKIYENKDFKKVIDLYQENLDAIEFINFFLHKIDKIIDINYQPSFDDILRVSNNVNNVVDLEFKSENNILVVISDLSIKKLERPNWINTFTQYTFIAFCVSLSDYDQFDDEKKIKNRMEKSIDLFNLVVNSKWFSSTSILLFLNKIDIFTEKLIYSSMKLFFPDYEGNNTSNDAIRYFLKRFKSVNTSDLNIYPFIINATDTFSIQMNFKNINNTILKNFV